MNLFGQNLRAWFREPVTLFLLLGVVLFALDRGLNGTPMPAGNGDRHIVVTAAQQQALREAFRGERGREPDAAELQARLDHWVEEQVLYREALALNLDRTDLIVRRQLTQKMRFLLEDAKPLPTATEPELQEWLDQHAQHYGVAPTISFEQVFFSRGRHADDLQAQAARAGALLARTPTVFAGLGDPFPEGQVITAATPVMLRRDFGAGFAEALQQLERGKWSGPIASGLGLHWVRVTAASEFRPAKLADVRQQVETDYQSARHDLLSREAVDRLKKKYRVDVEVAPS